MPPTGTINHTRRITMLRRRVRIGVAVVLPLMLQMSGCFLNANAYDCDGPCLEESEESHVNSYVCSCTCTTGSLRREIPVSASADDAEQTTVGNFLDSPVLDLVSPQVDGLRFANVEVPQGATVLSAHVQFTAADSDDEIVSFDIFGQGAVDPDPYDPAPFVQAPNDISGRPLTTNMVTWTPGA